MRIPIPHALLTLALAGLTGGVCAMDTINPSGMSAQAGVVIAAKRTLTLEGANRALSAAVAEARALNAWGAIAVVDDGGSLIAFQRLDGTFSASANVAIGKARTAAIFKKPTKAFEDAIKDGRMALTAVGDMTPLQGGVPIVHEGMVVGAIGVSGAHSAAEDERIALAGAAAVMSNASPGAASGQ